MECQSFPTEDCTQRVAEEQLRILQQVEKFGTGNSAKERQQGNVRHEAFAPTLAPSLASKEPVCRQECQRHH